MTSQSTGADSSPPACPAKRLGVRRNAAAGTAICYRHAAPTGSARGAWTMGSLRSFLIELRRRRVFRAAALYGAIAWLLIQVAATTFPLFDLPAWTVRAVVVLCVAGFPVAMLLAWAFDLRPSDEIATGAAPDARTASLWRSASMWLG